MSSRDDATTLYRWWRRPLVLSSAVAAAVACTAGSSYPSHWTALQAPAAVRGPERRRSNTASCPDLRGDYRIGNPVIFANLIAQHLTVEQRAAGWFELRISGESPIALVAELIASNTESRTTIPLRAGREFTCADGWALVPWPSHLLGSGPQVNDNRGYEMALQITRDRAGRMIGREVEQSHVEISVWCGDGCKYLPVPFTGRETIRWHRMSSEALADRDAGETPFAAAVNARLARDEQALMTGARSDARAERSRRDAMRVEERVLDPSR